jgi:hypothetical protein
MSTITFVEPPANLEAITNEKDFQRLVVDALTYLGWVVIHVDQMVGNRIGIPDLLCFRRGQGEMIELKVGKNTLSEGQRRWQERNVPDGETVVNLIRNTRDDWEQLMRVMG